jgi:SAM-dependent methyltransferase
MSDQTYSGIFAAQYDEIYKGKPYKAEADFLHRNISGHFSGRSVDILELACGTGTHSLHLSKFGYKILATDRSEDSLNIAKKKIHPDNLEFQILDMETPRDLGKFDVIICLFDSIGYLIENQKINRLFQFVKSSLKPDGLFIYEYWHAGAFLKHHETSRYRFFEQSNLHRISNTTINYEHQYASVNYKFFQDGNYYEETHNNRFFLTQEMNLFIEQNDFVLEKRFNGYSDDTNINDETWHILDFIKNK